MEIRTLKGFTLPELLITLAILAVLVAIAVPSFNGMMDRRKLIGAGEKLYADLMFAKTEAIKRNTPVTVSFIGNGANWCYGIAINNVCDCTAATCQIDGVQKVTNQDQYDGTVFVEVDSTLDGATTTFSPIRGTADAGHLRFSVSAGTELGVVVSSIGRVRLCSSSASFDFDNCP